MNLRVNVRKTESCSITNQVLFKVLADHHAVAEAELVNAHIVNVIVG